MLVIGATQSGKSTLAHLLALSWSRFIGQDPKAAARWVPPNTVVVRSGEAAAAAYPVPGRVMYHPPVMEERAARADFDVAMRRLFSVRGGGSLIHELASLTDPDNCEAGLNAVLFQGAELGIPMIYCTQEPVRIYRKFFSQATVVIVFYLVPEHRAYLARMCGAPAIDVPIPLDYTYGVWHRGRPEEFVRMPALSL